MKIIKTKSFIKLSQQSGESANLSVNPQSDPVQQEQQVNQQDPKNNQDDSVIIKVLQEIKSSLNNISGEVDALSKSIPSKLGGFTLNIQRIVEQLQMVPNAENLGNALFQQNAQINSYGDELIAQLNNMRSQTLNGLQKLENLPDTF